jgi:hypothetical protein
MMDFLTAIEDSKFAMAIAGSQFVYPTILTLHSVGMAFVAGVNTAISLCVLGAVPGVPMAPMEQFVRIVWWGFWLNAVTGFLLLICAPTRLLVDPVFFAKMIFVVAAVVNLKKMQTALFEKRGVDVSAVSIGSSAVAVAVPVFSARAKTMALAGIVLWILAITSGRMLAYTAFLRFWSRTAS